MIYKTDYHIHTVFSDGQSAPDDYIAPAIEAGIREIGFSEHFTLFRNSLDWSMNSIEEAESYLRYIKTLKAKSNGILIKAGLEVDYFPGRDEEILSALNGMDLDYVIGSVHYLGDKTVDLGPDFYKRRNIDRLYETYFGYIAAAAESGLFDIIAHLDLIRIFAYKPSFNPEPLYRDIARTLKIHDVAFELNTNGRNKPIGDFYPDTRFLHIFREEGVPVCVNSDSHMPSRVGQYFDEAYALIGKAGYTEMAVFDKRERYMIPFNQSI